MKKENWATLDSQAQEVLGLLAKGYNAVEISDIIGVSLDEWKQNKDQCPEFTKGVEKALSKHRKEINQAIWKLAVGYEYKETTVTEKELPSGDIEKTTTTTIRYVPPSLDACRIAHCMINNLIDQTPQNKTNRRTELHNEIKPESCFGKAQAMCKNNAC